MLQILVLMALLIGNVFGETSVTSQVIWDQWFTVTGSGGTHLEYFRERFEERGEHYIYQVERWTHVGGGKTRKETSRAVVRSRAALDPVEYRYEAPELQFEAGSTGDRRFRLLVREAGKPEKLTKNLRWPPRAVFANFFPVWLGEKSRQARPGRLISMLTMLSGGTSELRPRPTHVRFQVRDDFAKKNRAGKIEVIRSTGPGNSAFKETWWIDIRGLPIRIEREDHSVIERAADEAKARAFLERST